MAASRNDLDQDLQDLGRVNCLRSNDDVDLVDARIERQLLAVVKKGGDHEPFNRDKIKRGLARACWKRPVSEEEMEAVVSAFESELYGTYESEVPSRVIGERLMELLRSLDQVAFVRFASVYREFKDVRDFFEELEPILAEANRPVA